MKPNVGTIDRVIRIFAGLALIGLTLAATIGVWGWVGIVPLVTGIVRICPADMPFGMSTCAMKQESNT